MEELTKNKIDKTLLVFIFMLTELSNKRQGIISTDDESDIASCDQDQKNELILEIKEVYKMDYNEVLKLPYNDPHIIEYESVLNNYLSERLNKFRSSSFDEEMRILNSSVDINVKDFPRLEIEDYIDNKKIFSEIKESYKWVHSWILNPDYVSEITTGLIRQYVITKRVTNRYGRPSILFAFLKEIPNLSLNYYRLYFALMFDYKINIERLINPIRFFLNLIDKYGFEMEIGEGITKKLIFQDSISVEQYYEFHKSMVNLAQKVKTYGCLFGQYNTDDTDYKKSNTLYYGVHFAKYILDYKAKRI